MGLAHVVAVHVAVPLLRLEGRHRVDGGVEALDQLGADGLLQQKVAPQIEHEVVLLRHLRRVVVHHGHRGQEL